MMNIAQVENLFMKECALFGNANGISAVRAAELFGPNAAHRTIEDCVPGKDYALIKLNENCSALIFYYSGFKYAATVANIAELSNQSPINYDAKRLIKFPTPEKRFCKHSGRISTHA